MGRLSRTYLKMACKILNLIASVTYLVALFLFSFEPKAMGGIYKLHNKDAAEWGNYWGSINYPGEMLIHPFYISWTGKYDSGGWWMENEKEVPTDADCLARFGETDPDNFGDVSDLTDNGTNNFGTPDGLMDSDSELPCIVSIVNATSRSLYAQRRYANYVFGAAWESSFANDDFGYVSYGPRAFHTRDYNMDWHGTSGTTTDFSTFHPQMAQLSPNIWATQDAVFGLMQVSGFFMAFGIVFHILAFLMGGFVWNYSKACCDFGVCSFVFNSIVWSSLSLVCYMICVISFAGIFFQGVEQPETGPYGMPTETQLAVEWSVGGALILTSIVFSAIAISLASYQWARDKADAEDDKMEAAVADAVRRASRDL